ncbi:transketolase [Candidatus Merdisoma sp. JLR.KK006]|jgi:transketolase|uniref:transketolase n=1 Tax=Candidatus Merdisoma sp. JLR.KK006 TaxID=3112626 RepID=UPI002FF20057
MQNINEIKKFAVEIRKETIKCIGNLGVGHIGGALSIVDVLAVLYSGVMNVDPKDPKKDDRDMLVVSKGHAGPAVYAALALKGYFPTEMLDTLNKPGTSLPSHCDMNRTPGIDMTTGSLGQGASSAMGIACGNRLKGYDNYTYLIIGDGEAEEGQVWEAAIFAHAKKLSKVIAFVDYNKCQIDDYVEDLCAMGDIAGKFESFGWYAQNVEDGNDVEQILSAIANAKAQDERPSAIILNTVKGKGYSKIEGFLGSHNMPVSAEMVEEALAELCIQEKEIGE